jgi:hypothetical protein
MGEITANAKALLNDVGCGDLGVSAAKTIFDIVVHPVADGLHALKAVRHLAKFS